MKKIITIMLLMLTFLLVSCNVAIGGSSLKISNALGKGTTGEPYLLDMKVGESLSRAITAPEDLNLTFQLVKLVDGTFLSLSDDDAVGLNFNHDNSNTLLSLTALRIGTYYVKVSSRDLVAYVKVNVQANPNAVTGILVVDASGQGTKADPYSLTMEEAGVLENNLLVSPANASKNLMFALVKPDDNDFVLLTGSDEPGLSFNNDNGNDKLSITALNPGLSYIKIYQGEVEVYVKVNVTPLPDVQIDYSHSLKVLAIGNSFSDDGMSYLYQIANDYGIEEIILGILYIGGAELSQHASNATLNSTNYTYRKNTSGAFVSTSNKTLLDGILDEDWDIITLQQASGKSGRGDYYEPYLTDLIEFVNDHKTNEDAKLFWHLTWAYQHDSNHAEFPFYDSNQMTMYNAIIDTYEAKVSPHLEIKGLISAGTAIQNVRTSYVGDTLTQDGYHLNGSTGRYTASMTWFKAITGFDLTEISYKAPGVTAEDKEMIVEAVNNAVAKPLEVTESTFKVAEGTDPNLVDHTLLRLSWVLGYYQSENSHRIYNDAGNSINFITHDPRLSKDNLPVGSVIKIENGYQYRLNFFKTLDGTTEGNMRTANLTTAEVIVDEDWWGDYQYVGINISPRSTTDLTDIVDEVAGKIKIYAAPGATLPDVTHVDKPLSFVSGYWDSNRTDVVNLGNTFDLTFAASNILSKAFFSEYDTLTVADGYQVRLNFLTYDNKGGYKVVSRTNNLNGVILITDTLFGENEYVAFNLSKIGNDFSPTYLMDSELDLAPSRLVFSYEGIEDIPHVDEPLSFVSGYWNDNGNMVTNAGGTFDLGFAASNVLTVAGLADDSNVVTIADGYQIRVVILTYDNKGTYKVLERSVNFQGEIKLYELWDGFEYIAFNISKLPSEDLSGDLANLPAKLTFSFEEVPDKLEIPHVDEPLNFVLGYWFTGNHVMNQESTGNGLKFIGSNILSKEYMSQYVSFTLEQGYQARVIFFSYDGFGEYTVLYRTDNLTGRVLLDETLWGSYEYIGFNISAAGTPEIADRVEEVAGMMSLQSDELVEIPHVDEPLAFVAGYWSAVDKETPTFGDTSFDRQFAVSNTFSKAYFDGLNTLTVASGYQVRIINLSYDPITGIYKVLARTTANYTGEINLASIIDNFDYVAFNISKTTGTEAEKDLTGLYEGLSDKLSFSFIDYDLVSHVDSPVIFNGGYYIDNGTRILFDPESSFDRQFAYSNPQSKLYVSEYNTVTIAAGYKVRLVFLKYDDRGTYTVLKRSDFLTGEINLDLHWQEGYDYLAFNIGLNSGADIQSEVNTLHEKVVFSYVESTSIPHVDPDEISFVVGYWLENGHEPRTTENSSGDSNLTRFIASNIFSKEYFANIESFTMAPGYVARAIFLSYDGEGNYTVLKRTNSKGGTLEFTEELWADYEYIAFNIGKSPIEDVGDNFEEYVQAITFNFVD